MVLTMLDLFEEVARENDYHCTVSMSYLEVYNENIKDLFKGDSRHLQLLEDPKTVIMCSLFSFISHMLVNLFAEVSSYYYRGWECMV